MLNKLVVENVNRRRYKRGHPTGGATTLTKRPPRTRLAPDARRAQLLAEAIVASADHGIARVTHAHVAARAGVSVAAVHVYFRTRPDLVTAVLDAVAAAITAMVAESLSHPEPPTDALLRLATNTAAMAETVPDTVRVWLDWSSGVRADTWPRFLALQHALQAEVAGLLGRCASAAPAASIASAARLFVGCAHTLALMKFEDVDPAARDLFIRHMVGGTLAGLL